MAINQLSIFVENKQGALVKITKVLASNAIDIRAMSLAETQDFGILRLIVDDSEKAMKALKENNCVVSITKVVAAAVPDRPGGLSELLDLLTGKGINIEYMYAFISESKHDAYVVLRVEDNETADKVLNGEGIKLVTENDIVKL